MLANKPRTKLLVDGGDPNETLRTKILIGFVDGQTTNPSLGDAGVSIEVFAGESGWNENWSLMRTFAGNREGVSFLVELGSAIGATRNVALSLMRTSLGIWQVSQLRMISRQLKTESQKTFELKIDQLKRLNSIVMFPLPWSGSARIRVV